MKLRIERIIKCFEGKPKPRNSEKTIKTNYILVGSHLDSVPQGGNFDGLAGGVAGFLLLVNLKEKKIRTSFPIKVLILRGEESAWYGKNCIGSKALFGLLSLEDLNSTHRSSGDKLSKAMNASGAKLDLIKRSYCIFIVFIF